MLADCAFVKSIWQIIDKLGNEHWEDYNPLVYDLIPDILRSYDPINIYHVSALWAFWVTWCKHFYDPDPVGDWKIEVLTKLKEQFYKRIVEAPSMTQWIKLAQSRRTESDMLAVANSRPIMIKSLHSFYIRCISSALTQRNSTLLAPSRIFTPCCCATQKIRFHTENAMHAPHDSEPIYLS